MYNLIKYSSNYSETTGTLWFYSKDEATNFDAGISKTNNFKSLKCKAKLLENTEAQSAANEANEILKTATIAVSLKDLSHFWRSLEMSLINCKVELKLKWKKYFVLSAGCNDNDNDDSNNGKKMFLLSKTQNYMSLL